MDGGTKVYLSSSCHVTKMASMPICGTNKVTQLSNCFSSEATGPTETKFHVVFQWIKGTYVLQWLRSHD